MQLHLSDFCTRTDAEFSLLQRKIDECAALGRSYELRCSLPVGCAPVDAILGFCGVGGRYLLYVRPHISYCGTVSELAALLRPEPLSFATFSAMAQHIRELGHLINGTPSKSPPSPALFRHLRSALEQQVIGQESATETAAFHLYTHLSKKAPARPLSMILYGPTGVGKSELGKAVAPILSRMVPNQNWQTIWTDLNTFTQPHSVSRLIGSPPGYIGYDDRPIFEAVRQSPHTVFLFDELEKAHPEVLKVFMAILDEGRCTARREDEQGQRELDFRRCIFVFTTNLDLTDGAHRPIGFSARSTSPPSSPHSAGNASLARQILQRSESARHAMTRAGVLREIASRFTALIGFTPLDEASRRAVTAKQISLLGSEFGLHIVSISPALVAALTPQDAFSIRSTVAVLEGTLTPAFALYAAGSGSCRVHLSGSPEQPLLSAVREFPTGA